MTRLWTLCVASSTLAVIALAVTPAWAPTAVEYASKPPMPALHVTPNIKSTPKSYNAARPKVYKGVTQRALNPQPLPP